MSTTTIPKVAEQEQTPNPAQLEIINDTTHRLIAIDAGPGTGKTWALARRTAKRMHENHGLADSTLIVTFTNRARAGFERAVKKELLQLGETSLARRVRTPEERKETALTEPDPLWIETFHGLGRRIVECHLGELGLQKMPRIIDPDELRAYVRTALLDTGEGAQGPEYLNKQTADILDLFHTYVSHGLNPRGEELSQKKIHGRLPAISAAGKAVFNALGARMAHDNVWSIDDLTLQTFHLLYNDKAVEAAWANRWSEICIDEYQDTDPLLGAIVHPMARSATVIAAGDEAQSIYEWRGAIGTFSELGPFERTHGKMSRITATVNYRATNQLRRAASKLRPNEGSATSPEQNPNGMEPYRIDCANPKECFAAVDAWATMLKHDQAKLLGRTSIGILTSTRKEGRQIADELTARGHEIWLGGSMSDAEPLLAWRAWWRCVAADEPTIVQLGAALPLGPERVPLRTMYDRLREFGRRGESAWPCLCRAAAQDRGEARQPLSKAIERLQGLRAEYQTKRPGAPEALDEEGEPNATTESRATLLAMEAVTEELQTQRIMAELGDGAIEQWTLWWDRVKQMAAESPDVTAADVEQQLGERHALAQEPPPNAIEIHTMHSAKGLEWDAVCLWRWEEGNFPRFAEPDNDDEAVAHVAASRARRVLTAIVAAKCINGTHIPQSRYLNQMGARMVRYPGLVAKDDPFLQS